MRIRLKFNDDGSVTRFGVEDVKTPVLLRQTRELVALKIPGYTGWAELAEQKYYRTSITIYQLDELLDDGTWAVTELLSDIPIRATENVEFNENSALTPLNRTRG